MNDLIKIFLKKKIINPSEIEELRYIIRFLDKKYYVENFSEVSDLEYDRLFSMLKEVENRYPELITEDSPTQRISPNIQDGFNSREHIIAMLSLNNTYNEEDLKSFDEQVKKMLLDQDYEYITELKFDGISVSLTYKNGILTNAVTRGNGAEGEDITQNVRTISSIPLKIDTPQIDILEIRGEIIMPKDILCKINEELQEKGLNPYANTRNAASGSVRQLDPSITKERKLDAYFYQLIRLEDNEYKTYIETIQFLKNMGFKISPYLKTCKDIDQVINECLNAYNNKTSYPFDIDGLVLKINNIEQQKLLGQTSHHPKWAIAYKFPAERAETVIEDIIVQVGRTGVLTPVAVLKPVKLSGVIIARATLHNQDEINKKDIRIGDTVIIERAGEVIPSVIEVNLAKRPKVLIPFKLPESCPVCGSKTERLPEEVALRCINLNCTAQIKRRLEHFCCRECMDIEGMGGKIIDNFVEKNVLNKLSDIYRLKDHSLKLSTEHGFGGKSIQNLLDSIESSKNKELWRLIHGLGIKYIGKKVSKTLAQNIQNVFDLKDMTEEKLLSLSEIGDKTSITIREFFEKEENINLLKELESLGVNLINNKEENKKLADKNFVITGQMKILQRKNIEKLIETNGGTVLNSISSKTDFLICGENPGSKLQKANELNTKVIQEVEFLEMINLSADSIVKPDEMNQGSLF